MTQPTDKEPTELDGIVGALILLLKDRPEKETMQALREALPQYVVSKKGDPPSQQLRHAAEEINEALGVADGSSGLGALGAKQVNQHLRRAAEQIKRAREVLGYISKDTPPRYYTAGLAIPSLRTKIKPPDWTS